jgi:hypothetical protein
MIHNLVLLVPPNTHDVIATSAGLVTSCGGAASGLVSIEKMVLSRNNTWQAPEVVEQNWLSARSVLLAHEGEAAEVVVAVALVTEVIVALSCALLNRGNADIEMRRSVERTSSPSITLRRKVFFCLIPLASKSDFNQTKISGVGVVACTPSRVALRVYLLI